MKNDIPKKSGAVQETIDWHRIYRSESLHQRRNQTHPAKLRKLGVLDLPKQSAILDVCCGTGEMLELLVADGFKNLTGVSLEPNIASPSQAWRFIQGSAMQLPVESESMDMIYCAHALHHLGSMQAIESFMSEAWRCLKPGGQLGIIDHFDSLQLRCAFYILQSPLGNIFSATRDFHRQLLEEKAYLYPYLDSWESLKKKLGATSFKNHRIEKDAFFFYWTGFKNLN